jgi:LysM repeat protein
VPGPRPVRLTRRGRALIRSLVLLAVVLTALMVTLANRHDEVTPVASSSMVVAEDDTLWSIAERVAPDQPLSVTMARIQKLNDLPDATVRVGQRLLLPATPSRASDTR